MNRMLCDNPSARRRFRSGPSSKPASGITLLELLMSLAIAAIVMALGMPSYTYVTTNNRMAGEVNGLLGDLQFARGEAIKEGQTVTVCSSSNGTSCSGSASWKSGWIVFSDPNNNQTVDASETIYRVQRAFTSSDTFNADNTASAVTFNREGFASAAPTAVTPITITLHDSTSNLQWTRCLAIQTVGMLVTQKHGTGNCS
jgi:type IV fimbrial biogenesis protein FimT